MRFTLKTHSEYLLLFSYLIYLLIAFANAKRGPHHPKSELSPKNRNNKIDNNPLQHNENHIAEDLKDWGFNIDKEQMTEEEKHFYYFKVHDNDNNNALDGLEMLHAAIHQDNNHHFDNNVVDSNNDGDDNGKFEFDLYHLDNNKTMELDRIIDLIDDFISIADLNNDGLLQYPEYIKAITNQNQIENNDNLNSNNVHDNFEN